MTVRVRIESLVRENPVVVFMKGTRKEPRCGFSATVVEVLDDYLDEYVTIDVLSDPDLREGIKEYTSWPTIPQLFVRGEFVGGADIVREMAQGGELESVLGVKAKELETPEVTLTTKALAALRGFQEEPGEPVVRLQISPQYQYGMDFDEPRPGDVAVRGPGYTILLDKASARRADGTTIDFVEREDGGGFKIDNPNEPPKVRSITAPELAKRIAENAPMTIFDVRTADERAIAHIPGTVLLDAKGKEILDALDRSSILVFQCHHGVRSAAAAQHALRMGFSNVYNLEGGIDAWSREVDASVPRY